MEKKGVVNPLPQFTQAEATNNYTRPGIPSSSFRQHASLATCMAKASSITNAAYIHGYFLSECDYTIFPRGV